MERKDIQREKKKANYMLQAARAKQKREQQEKLRKARQQYLIESGKAARVERRKKMFEKLYQDSKKALMGKPKRKYTKHRKTTKRRTTTKRKTSTKRTTPSKNTRYVIRGGVAYPVAHTKKSYKHKKTTKRKTSKKRRRR